MPEPGNTVLVVDDEEEVRASLGNALTDWGYSVEEAESGEEAIDAALRLLPTLVLLDVMMPGIGGIEALRAIRDTPETGHIPVVMVTAVSDYELGVEWTPESVAARTGVRAPEGILDKPVDLRALRALVDDLATA